MGRERGGGGMGADTCRGHDKGMPENYCSEVPAQLRVLLTRSFLYIISIETKFFASYLETCQPFFILLHYVIFFNYFAAVVELIEILALKYMIVCMSIAHTPGQYAHSLPH